MISLWLRAYFDQKHQRLTFCCFKQDLEEHGGDAAKVTDFSIDMSKAFIKGIGEEFENAAITFDKFHVIKIIIEKRRQFYRQSTRDLRGAKGFDAKDCQSTSDQGHVAKAL
jgi:transposase